MESTLPKLTDALDLHPTETVNSPTTIRQTTASRTQYLVPAEDQARWQTSLRGVLKGAGGLTSGQSMATMAGAAATGGLLSPAVPVIGRLMALGFSVQTANDLVHQAPQLIDANKRGDDEAFYEGLGRIGFDSVMLATMMRHAATGGAPGEVAPEESAPEAPQSVSPIQSTNVPAEAPETQASAQQSAIPPFLRAKLRAQQVPVVTPDQAPSEPGAPVAPETTPELEPEFAKGPGAKTAGTSDNPGSNLADLTRSLPAVESPQASPIDRMKTAASMAGQEIAAVPQKLATR